MKYNLLFFSGLILSLASCNSNSGLPNKEIKSVPNSFEALDEERSDYWLQLQSAYAERRLQGTDFYAMGDDWTLTIDEDKAIRFSSNSKDADFTAPGAEGLQPADLNATLYNVYTESGSLSIRLSPDTCTNQKGENMPYKVNVSIKKGNGQINTYDGCGLYLNNPVLNDIWALKTWNRYSDSLQTAGFPGNPFIEINLRTKRLIGNFGCGDVEGYLTPKGNKIKIYGLDYLNKPDACDSEIAQDLFDYLNYNDHYVSIDGLKLQLATTSDTLVFQKVD